MVSLLEMDNANPFFQKKIGWSVAAPSVRLNLGLLETLLQECCASVPISTILVAVNRWVYGMFPTFPGLA